MPSVPPPGPWGVVVDELEDDEDSEEEGDDAPTDDSFDYLQDFDLERGDAIQRLVDLEAAALEELAGDADPNADLREPDADDDRESGRSEAREATGDALRDPDAVADRLEAEDDAAFDHPSVRDAIETGSAFTSTAFADASELEDLELRHQRPSRWGRLDLTIAWRRMWTPHPVTISLGPLPHGPLAQTYDTADSLLVLATWSR